MANQYTRLSEHLFVHHGVVNTGILRYDDRALIIDFGDGSVQNSLNELNISKVDMMIFTHYHRDQVSGVTHNNNINIGVPEQEKSWFSEVEKFWNDPANRWHLYNYHPSDFMLTESIPVTKTYKEGDVINWGNAKISVINTPGHTDGSVSYVVDVDNSRFVFCGDVIYDEGKILELYSMQKGEVTSDYHGFLGSRKQLKQSLQKLCSMNPTALIPSHGNIIKNPSEAINTLVKRLDECYDKYVAISALRYYFPDMFSEFKGREGHLPYRDGKSVPECLRHFGTSWIIISQTKNIFVIDCGNQDIIKKIQELQEKGEVANVDGLWVTHFHDDHVDAVPQFKQAFKCPIYVDSSFADMLENPRGYRMPCISPSSVMVDHHTKDGESWEWEEFRITAYHFPGQTYYHGGLLVEGHGVRMFFAGDSFTMAGIDDYCSGNRNWLGEGTGFDLCLKLMQDLKPTHIFNCHVDPAFDFTDQELEFMRANLAYREKIYGELFPWDSPNYGMDEYWVKCYPYEQDAIIGKTVNLRVDIINHSSSEKKAICKPIFPIPWNLNIEPKSIIIPPKKDGYITFSFSIPRSITAKRVIIPIEVTYDNRNLGQFREAILVINE